MLRSVADVDNYRCGVLAGPSDVGSEEDYLP